MEDSQLLVKMASGDWVVVPGTKGWETGVRASGEGGQNKFRRQPSLQNSVED